MIMNPMFEMKGLILIVAFFPSLVVQAQLIPFGPAKRL